MKYSPLMIGVGVLLTLVVISCSGATGEWNSPSEVPGENGDGSYCNAVSAMGPDGTLYVAFMDGGYNYYVSRSSYGSTFSTPVKVNSVWNRTTVGCVDIGVGADGRVHVVFTQARENRDFLEVPLWYSCSRDGGGTFTDALPIIDHGGRNVTRDPKIMIDDASGSIWVAAGTSESIEVVRSADGGRSWSGPVVVSRDTGTMFQYPDMVMSDEGVIHLVYRQQVGAFKHVLHTISSDGGETFTTPKELSPDDNGEPLREHPFVFIDGFGQVRVTFTDADFGPGIVMMTSFDGGATFQAPKIVAQGEEITWIYDCVMDVKGRFHFVYWDVRGPKVVRYVADFQNETTLRGPTNTTFDDPNTKGFVLDLAMGLDGTLHAFRSLPPGYGAGRPIQHTRLPNVPPACRVTNLLDGETVRDAIKVLMEAEPGDDRSAIEEIQVRFDDGEWIDVSEDTTGSYIWDTTSMDDGRVDLWCRAWDGFVWGGTSIGVEVQNNDPPTLAPSSPEVDGTYQETMVISGRADDTWGFFDGWSLERSWDGKSWTTIPGAMLVDEKTVEFDSTVNISDLARGDRTLHLRISDGVLHSDPYKIPIILNWLPDLVVGPEDIEINPNDTKGGEVCTIEVTIWNQGRGPSDPVQVSLESQEGPVSMPLELPSLDPGEATVVSFPWKARGGVVTFTVVIDQFHEIDEEEDGNNVAITEFKIPKGGNGDNGIPGNTLGLVILSIGICYVLLISHRKRDGPKRPSTEFQSDAPPCSETIGMVEPCQHRLITIAK